VRAARAQQRARGIQPRAVAQRSEVPAEAARLPRVMRAVQRVQARRARHAVEACARLCGVRVTVKAGARCLQQAMRRAR